MPSEPGTIVPRFLFLLGLLLTLLAPVTAQQTNSQSRNPADLTLDAILVRLQNNLAIYKASVPDFFCDEHVVSNMYARNQLYRRTTTDSIFRLKRLGEGKSADKFTESREVKVVDKKPVQKQDLKGPAIFAGAFSNALEIVSLDYRSCYNYQLVPHQRFHRHPILVIDYQLKSTAANEQACPGPEMNDGRAFIDPQTMEIVRMEQRTPDHEINPGSFGLWTWSIDYAMVIFNDKPFWMPKTVTSSAAVKATSLEWSFIATYRNYHKLTVTSRVLPDVDYDPKQ